MRDRAMGEEVPVDAETPWIRGRVTLTRAALAAVESDALRGYAADEEACGYLRGPAGSLITRRRACPRRTPPRRRPRGRCRAR